MDPKQSSSGVRGGQGGASTINGIERNGQPDQNQLNQAAKAFGVEIEYWDVWGQKHEASREAKESILRSLGVETGTSTALHESLESWAWKDWCQPLPSTIVLT